METKKEYIAGLYCRLSKDDDLRGESLSIGTQRSILTDYCEAEGLKVYKVYVDDGFSGLNFERPGFKEMLADIDSGLINMVITKDLSRLGRDYIMTGYYSEIFFPMCDVRYVAVSDNYDSLKSDNDIAPFKNILNDMYAKDISKKIKNAKRQRAKQGLFTNSQAPYGYMKDPGNRNHLAINPETAENVRLIYALALEGMGTPNIAKELQIRKIMAPAAYASANGEKGFDNCRCITEKNPYLWNSTTVRTILGNRVYTGDMVAHKYEVVNYKTKQVAIVPEERRIVTHNTHEPIISKEDFEKVQEIISQHQCPAKYSRTNIFRGLLFCSDCGHPLSIAHKKLTYREEDLYRCMYHYHRPDVCPETHSIYHNMLYDYVLAQVKAFSKSLKRRKVVIKVTEYGEITELTPEILNAVIERIEVGHVTRKAKPGKVISIYWKLT